MSQYRSGIINSTTALIASGFVLPLGFIPDRFRIVDLTVLENGGSPGSVTGYAGAEWFKPMPSASAFLTKLTAGVPTISYITTAGITPQILGGDWQSTQYTITAITQANPGVVTVASISPTNTMTLVNGMTVTISGVVGMTQLNTNRYIVSNLTIVGGGPTYTFTLYDTFGNPVNTAAFGAYISGGIVNEISYPATAPILNPVNGQVVTPGQPAGNQYDIGYEGLLIGPSTAGNILGSNGDQLWWEAIWQTPTGF